MNTTHIFFGVLRQSLLLCIISILGLTSAHGAGSEQETEYYDFKRISRPEIIAEGKKPKLMPAGFLSRRLRMGYPSLKYIDIKDRNYVYITEKWFEEVVERTHEWVTKLLPDIDFTNNPPSDYPLVFATLASNIANFAVAKRYNIKSSVLIGFMRAKSMQPWEAIPGDGAQRIYIVALLQKGGTVYDLQTRQKIPFEQFPNLDHMSAIVF